MCVVVFYCTDCLFPPNGYTKNLLEIKFYINNFKEPIFIERFKGRQRAKFLFGAIIYRQSCNINRRRYIYVTSIVLQKDCHIIFSIYE